MMLSHFIYFYFHLFGKSLNTLLIPSFFHYRYGSMKVIYSFFDTKGSPKLWVHLLNAHFL